MCFPLKQEDSVRLREGNGVNDLNREFRAALLHSYQICERGEIADSISIIHFRTSLGSCKVRV